MSKQFEELCTLLVDGTLGNLPSRLFSILFKQGRQPLPVLTQRSRLPPRYVKSGLAILVQHRLVSYLTSNDDNVTYYEADARSAYDLLRSGKHVQLFHNTVGADDGGLTEKFCFEGSISTSEIASLGAASVRDTSVGFVNGVTNGDKLSNGVTRECDEETSHTPEGKPDDVDPRETLFSRGYAVQARGVDYMSSHDFVQMVKDDITHSEYGGDVKAKYKAEFEQKVHKQLNGILGSNRVNKVAVRDLFQPKSAQKRAHEDTETCMKRHPQQRTDPSRPQKQRKLNRGHGYDTVSEQGPDVDMQDALGSRDSRDVPKEQIATEATDDSAYRINREKFDVARRNEKLVTLSAQCLGETAARVYKALLQCVERRVRRCFDPYAANDGASEVDYTEIPNSGSDFASVSPAIGLDDIEAHLDPRIDLTSLLNPLDDAKGAKVQVEGGAASDSAKHKKNGFRTIPAEVEGINGAVGKYLRTEQLRKVLEMLRQHPLRFVDRTTPDRDTKWRVNFPALSRTLIQREIEAYIQSRFGPVAARIVRFLKAKGRIEEKTVAGLLLLPHREVRYHCDAMHQAGILEIQEVPRDNIRTIKSSFWLWFYDQDRTRRDLLHNVYRTMSRLLQRLKVERGEVQSVLQKAERSDVKGHEDEYLSETERNALNTWNMKEGKILVELLRLDDTVAVLRDFTPSKVE